MINALIAIIVTAGAWVLFYYLIEYTIGWGKKGNDTPPESPQTHED